MYKEEDININNNNVIEIDPLLRYPQFKILTDFNFESESLFKFVYENSITSGKDLEEILFFSIYNYLNLNQNILTPNVFFEVFKNLKKFIIMNNRKSFGDLPLFYYQTIYKSICHFNKYIVDWDAFYNANNVEKLEEILEFLPDLMSKLQFHYEKANATEIKKCIDQINVFYEHLWRFNESYNRVNKQMVTFFLNNVSPLANSNSNSINNALSESLSYSEISSIRNNDSGYNINELDKSLLEKVREKEKKLNDMMIFHEQNFDKKDKEKDNVVVHNQNRQGNYIAVNFPPLVSKVKKYSENHYTLDKFKDKFLSPNNINEKNLYDKLEEIALVYFSDVMIYCNQYKQNFEMEKLKQDFTSSFDFLSLDMIGSLSLDLFSNLVGRTDIDLVVLPNENPVVDLVVLPIGNSVENFKNMNELINLFKEYNDEYKTQNKSHRFIIDDINEDYLQHFFFDAMIYSKDSDTTFTVKLFLFKQELKISNDYLLNLFKIEKLRVLHIFFQELLISKIGNGLIFSYRSDISVLLLAFIDDKYSVLNKEEQVDVPFNNLVFDKSDTAVDSDIKFRKLKIDSVSNYYYKINEENLNKIENISTGELIVEFFRYLINLLHFVKFEFNKSTVAKGYEVLKKNFEQQHLKDSAYYFNICFVFELCKMKQEEFIKEILKRTADLENIFFKICESSDKIRNYEQIISSIGKN